MAKVGVLMGSQSDSEVMKECTKVLEELGVEYELRVLSAHRLPDMVSQYAREAQERGIEVLIAGAGWAAHLAGALAANANIPVIGVPIDSSPLQGLDALLSTVQMPPGVPVATMSIGKGGARNAAIFAAQILSLKYPQIKEAIVGFRERMRKDAMEKSGL